jgi:hypothetical protein
MKCWSQTVIALQSHFNLMNCEFAASVRNLERASGFRNSSLDSPSKCQSPIVSAGDSSASMAAFGGDSSRASSTAGKYPVFWRESGAARNGRTGGRPAPARFPCGPVYRHTYSLLKQQNVKRMAGSIGQFGMRDPELLLAFAAFASAHSHKTILRRKYFIGQRNWLGPDFHGLLKGLGPFVAFGAVW